MRKCCLLLLILCFSPSFVFAKGAEKFDVKDKSFINFGRYVETFEINEEEKISEDTQEEASEEDADEFELSAIKEVANRYNKNAVNLQVKKDEGIALFDVNYDRIFKLKVNEAHYNIEKNIKSESMIWDSSKAFTEAFHQTSKFLSPIPSVINDSYVSAKISPELSATIGQKGFYSALGPELLFIKNKETTYNVGSIISYRANGLNVAISSYLTSYNHNQSGGFIVSTDAYKLPKNTGSFLMGAAYYSTAAENNTNSTTGVFGEYAFKRLKLNAQVADNKYTGSTDYGTSFYLVPQLQLSNDFFLKTRIVRNISMDTSQDELVLSYKPKNNKNDFCLELNASNHYSQNFSVKQRIKLSTSFSF